MAWIDVIKRLLPTDSNHCDNFNAVTGEIENNLNEIKSLNSDAISLEIYTQNIGRDTYWNTDPTIAGNSGAWSDRQMLFLADSHGWGEGSPNYQGASLGYNQHSAWIHNKGFYSRLTDYLYKKFDSEPWRCIPLFDKSTPLVRATVPTTLFYGNADMKSEENIDTFTVTPEIKQGRYYINTIVSSELATQGQKDYLKTFCNSEAREDVYAQTEYKYNANIGLLGKGILNIIPDIDRVNNEFTQVVPNPNYDGTGMTPLSNFCGGQSGVGTAFLQVLTIPDWVKVGANVYIPSLGTAKVVALIKVPEQVGRSLIYIKTTTDANITLTTSTITADTKIYNSLTGKSCVLFPMKTPSRYAILHLSSGLTSGAKCKIELLDDSIKNNGGTENWKQVTTGFGNQNYGTLAPKVWLCTPDNTADLILDTNAVISTSSITIDTSITGYNFETYYIIDFGQKKKGTIRISHVGNGINYTTPISPFDTSSLSTRGMLLGNRDLIRNWGFGGHTVGAWLGLETSVNGETRNHIADAKSYSTGKIKSLIIQAPIINEWLKQTSIINYKERLTQLTTDLGCSNVIIFTTLGLKNREYDTDEGVIKFENYAQATKDWATEQGGEVTFIDCRGYLKNLVSSGIIADYNDLYVNNGHPSPMSNELMFEMLKKVVDMKF